MTGNPLIVSRARLAPWEDFDRPDGVLVQGMQTKSGHVLLATGAGAAAAVVNNRGVIAADNTYMMLTDSQLITEVWGVFSQEKAEPDDQFELQVVIMFSSDGSTVINAGLIHAQVSAVKYSVEITTTGPSGLVPLETVADVSERYGLTTDGVLLHDPRGGTLYSCGLTYARGASAVDDVISFHLPDGRIIDFTNCAEIRTVMDGAYHGVWQLTGAAEGQATPKWHAFQIGPRKSDKTRALGGAASLADAAWLTGEKFAQRHRRTLILPQGGWYTVAEGVVFGGLAVAGAVRLTAVGTTVGNFNQAWEFRCSAQSAANVVPELTSVHKFKSIGFDGQWPIEDVRLSYNDAPLMHLDLHVPDTGANPVTVSLDCIGFFKLLDEPIAGATPLDGTHSTVLSFSGP